MRRARRTFAIVALSLVSCSAQVLPASTPTSHTIALKLYATTATIPLLNDLVASYTASHPDFVFEVLTGNYQIALEKLAADEIPYFLSNHLPDDTTNVPIMAWPLGQDGLAVIVHPTNPVMKLTTNQLRGIYLGHVSNWREVGGEDTDITVISREDGSGTRAEFERLIIGERRTTQSAQIAPSSAAMIASVGRERGGIGYVSMSYLSGDVRALIIDGVQPTLDNVYDNTYPLRATLYVVGLDEPEDNYRNLIYWLQSPDGQAVVGQHYAPMLSP